MIKNVDNFPHCYYWRGLWVDCNKIRIRNCSANIITHFPLGNFAKCPVCGGFLTGSWSRGRKEKYAYYHCRNKNCPMYGKAIKKERFHQDFIGLLSQIKPKEGYLNPLKEVVIDLWPEKYKFMAQGTNRLEGELEQLKLEKGN